MSRYVWWIVAGLGLCLSAIDDDELQRLRLQRLRLTAPLVGAGLIFTVLAPSLNASPLRGILSSDRELIESLQSWIYVAAIAAISVAVWVYLYVRAKISRAHSDRTADPIATRAALRGIIRARVGGSPVRICTDAGTWMWLTGSMDLLSPIARHVVGKGERRAYRVTIAVVYHPRSRVIKEIAGLKVEVLVHAWSFAETDKASVPGVVPY